MKRKMKISWPLVIIAIASLLLFAAATALPDDDEGVCIINDAAICDAVNTELMIDKYVPAHLLKARVRRGVVILEGEARSPLGKANAVARVKNINGVRGVIDNIKMAPPMMKDEDLHRRVYKALASDLALDIDEITINVYRGYVRISGKTDSWARRRLAQLDAESVTGVRAVVNDIYVSFSKNRPDDQVAIEILRLIQMDPFIDESLIDVRVTNRLAIVCGTVGSDFQRAYIGRLVREAGAYDADLQDLSVGEIVHSKMRRFEPPRPSDDGLVQSVCETLIFDKRVNKEDITVSVKNSVVTLTGETQTPSARIAAEADALNTVGVSAVRNSITVSAKFSPTDEEITHVANELIRRASKVNTIKAYVSQGEVTLVGTVPTGLEKLCAMERAAAIPGVVRVDNRIYTGGDYAWRRDEQIKRDMTNAMEDSPFVKPADITFTVKNGLAVISGTVDDLTARKHVEDIAAQSGVRFLRNILRVRECEQE